MNIEKFLLFWSQYNTLIIESLIGLVILLSLFLAYRSFFGKKTEHADDHASAGNGNIDAGQLEKTLQKILENQTLGAKLSANDDLSVSAEIDESSAATAEPGNASSEAAQQQVTQLRASLGESAKKIEILKTQLAQAQEQAATAQAAAPAPAGGGGAAAAPGMSTEERDEMNGKLRDLEARLAEYEIISEDIADLSRYREENDDLKKQIDNLKSQPAPVAPAPAPAPVAPVAAAAPPPPEPVAPPEPALAAEPEVVAEPEPTPEPVTPKLAAVPDEALAATVAELTPEPAVADPSADLIDDDLMKEFAAAVEGQKLDKVAKKAGDGSEKPTTNTDDTDKLMDEFENFVGNKKS